MNAKLSSGVLVTAVSVIVALGLAAYVLVLEHELVRLKASYRGTLTVSWKGNPEPGVVGYRVYCGTASKVYSMTKQVDRSRTAEQVTDLPAGTYHCAVTAYNNANLESGPSQEVIKVLP